MDTAKDQIDRIVRLGYLFILVQAFVFCYLVIFAGAHGTETGELRARVEQQSAKVKRLEEFRDTDIKLNKTVVSILGDILTELENDNAKHSTPRPAGPAGRR